MPLGTIQSVGVAGLAPSYATPNSSEQIAPNSGVFLHVKNASGSVVTVTLVDSGTSPAGSATVNPTVSVPATTGDRMIYIPAAMVNPATGTVQVNFSATASVTAALIRVGV